MSLILEALKKSEAERQLGRAPGLMSPMVRVSKRRGLNPWWGVLGLALAVAGGAAWWVRNAPPQVPVASPIASRDTPAAPVDAPTNAPAPGASAATSTGDAPTPALAAAPAASLPSENAALLPRDPEFDSVERESMPVPAQPTPAPPAPIASTVPPIPRPPEPSPAPSESTLQTPPPTTEPAPARPSLPEPPTAIQPAPMPVQPTLPAPTPTQPPLPTPPPATEPAPTPTQPPPPSAATLPAAAQNDGNLATVDATPPQAAPPAAAPAQAQAPLERLPLVHELMPEVRNALPALKLTMHVYTAAPETRFVLIDGKRYAQGERISAALTVAEIRSDGAVLEFDGKRFVVPRP